MSQIDTAALKASWERGRGRLRRSPAVLQFGTSIRILFLSHPEVRSMFPIQMSGQRDKLASALGAGRCRLRARQGDALLEQLGRDHRRFSVVTEHCNSGWGQPARDR